MYGHRCIRCGQYWSSQAHPDQHDAIVTYCPNCIPVIADGRLDPAGPPPPLPRHYRARTSLIQQVG
jgi:hypothetical protein